VSSSQFLKLLADVQQVSNEAYSLVFYTVIDFINIVSKIKFWTPTMAGTNRMNKKSGHNSDSLINKVQ
jgi:hypothetical protein